MSVCDVLNKVKEEVSNQWAVEKPLIEQQRSLKHHKRNEMKKEVEVFIKCFNTTYPEMKAFRPWFDFNGSSCISVQINRRRGRNVAKVWLYDDGIYSLLTGISCFSKHYKSFDSLVTSQEFINCLKPNADPILPVWD